MRGGEVVELDVRVQAPRLLGTFGGVLRHGRQCTPHDIRRLRDFTSYRVDLVSVRNSEKNRDEKLLEDACLKLSVVASDIFGASGRAMLATLIAGERDPNKLAEMARTRMQAKIPQLQEAFAGLLTGTFDDHHRFPLDRMIARIDRAEADMPTWARR